MSTSEARLNQEKIPALDQPERLMQRLLRFENAAAPVISLYLDGHANQCSAANDYFEAGQFAAPLAGNRLFVYDRRRQSISALSHRR